MYPETRRRPMNNIAYHKVSHRGVNWKMFYLKMIILTFKNE